MVRVLEGHSSSVLSLALSVDGKTLFSGSEDNTIRQWDVETGALLSSVSGTLQDNVFRQCLTSDGKHQFVASGSGIQLREIESKSGVCLWKSGPWRLSAVDCKLDASTNFSQANRKLLQQHGALDASLYLAGNLVKQVALGRFQAVKWLLQEGKAPINEVNAQGQTALFLAISLRNLDMVEWLLQEGGASLDEMGPATSDTATSLNDLAIEYRNNQQYSKAEPLFERALKIKEELVGPRHLDTARALAGLGRLYALTGRTPEAIPLLERALSIYKEAGDEDRTTQSWLDECRQQASAKSS
jgi:tetratricopeptide (TPR) repeat protein